MSGNGDPQDHGRKYRVVVIDDHPIVREGIVRLLQGYPELSVVGQAALADEAIRAVSELKPDLALLDLSLRNGSGIELLKQLRAAHEPLAVVVLSNDEEKVFAETALRAGARAFIMKHDAPETLRIAIRDVMQGKVYVSTRLREALFDRLAGARRADPVSPIERLTQRELEIFQMIATGQPMRHIAQRLRLSLKTVEAHRQHIKKKLDLKNSAALLRYAVLNTMANN